MSFIDVFADYLKAHEFSVQSDPGEVCLWADRVSSVTPQLLECIDVLRSDEGNAFVPTAYFALASKYDPPAWLLYETARWLTPTGLLHEFRSEKEMFSADQAQAAINAAQRWLLPWLSQQANLTALRNLYLFTGSYTRKGVDFSAFKAQGLWSGKTLRRPRVVALLEAYLGDYPQAIRYLKLHGIPKVAQQQVSDPKDVEPEVFRSWCGSEILRTYSKSAVIPWEITMLHDLERKHVECANAADVLRGYRRVDIASGFSPLPSS